MWRAHRIGVFFPYWHHHAKRPIVLIQNELEAIGIDVDTISDFKDRLEANTFLADGVLAFLFGTLVNVTDSLYILRAKSNFIALYHDTTMASFEGQVWLDKMRVAIVIGILNNLRDEVRRMGIYLNADPIVIMIS